MTRRCAEKATTERHKGDSAVNRHNRIDLSGRRRGQQPPALPAARARARTDRVLPRRLLPARAADEARLPRVARPLLAVLHHARRRRLPHGGGRPLRPRAFLRRLRRGRRRPGLLSCRPSGSRSAPIRAAALPCGSSCCSSGSPVGIAFLGQIILAVYLLARWLRYR